MLGVQLDFEGNKMVVKDGVRVGILSDDCKDPFLYFLSVNNYYKSMFNHILNEVERKGYDWYVGANVIGGELVINVTRDGKSIMDVFKGCFDYSDGETVVINYLRCKKVYIIKPSIRYVKSYLHKAGVIK